MKNTRTTIVAASEVNSKSGVFNPRHSSERLTNRKEAVNKNPFTETDILWEFDWENFLSDETIRHENNQDGSEAYIIKGLYKGYPCYLYSDGTESYISTIDNLDDALQEWDISQNQAA